MFRLSIIFYNVGLFQALNLCLLRKPLHVRRVFPGRGQLCDHPHAPCSSSPTNAGCLSRVHVNALERPAFISTNPFNIQTSKFTTHNSTWVSQPTLIKLTSKSIQVLHSIQYREDQEQSMKPGNSEFYRQHFSSNIFYSLSDLVILGRLNAMLCVNIQTTNMEIKKTCSKVHDPL